MVIKKPDLYSSLWASCDELRGGMDASQYKHYVLFMLFIKYISDKYADSDDFAPPVNIPAGASFRDMIALKGKSDIGDKINALFAQWRETNTPRLKGFDKVEALEALDQLQPGTALQLVPEDHPRDHFALRLEDGAAQLLGYCPRYLNQSLRAVLRETPIQLRVARNNHQAPIQFRLLCEARFPGKAGKRFYGSDEHRPLAPPAAA